ncbi:hypothetical protein D9M69_501700 [compost metagenome]
MPGQPMETFQHGVGEETAATQLFHLGVGERLDEIAGRLQHVEAGLFGETSQRREVESGMLLQVSLRRGQLEWAGNQAHLQRQQAMHRMRIGHVHVHQCSFMAKSTGRRQQSRRRLHFVQQSAEHDDIESTRLASGKVLEECLYQPNLVTPIRQATGMLDEFGGRLHDADLHVLRQIDEQGRKSATDLQQPARSVASNLFEHDPTTVGGLYGFKRHIAVALAVVLDVTHPAHSPGGA